MANITTQETEEFLNNVVRALGSLDSGVSDYKRLDYDEVIALAATINTPMSARLHRKATAKDVVHYWLDQSLTHAGATNAQSESADPAEGSYNKPTRLSNVLQILAAKVIITDTMERIAKAGGLIGVQGSELGRQVQLKLKELLRDQEYAFHNAVLAATDPRQMNGILAVIPSGNQIDAAAVQITSANVESYINQMMTTAVNAFAGAIPNALYVPGALLNPLHDAAKSKVQIVTNLTDLAGGRAPKYVAGAAVGHMLTDFGMLELVFDPLLPCSSTSGAAATSRAMALYEDAIEIVDMVGSGIEVQDRAKAGPTMTKVISEELTLEVRYLSTHTMLKNFYV